MRCQKCFKISMSTHDNDRILCDECYLEFKRDVAVTIALVVAMILIISFLGDAKW